MSAHDHLAQQFYGKGIEALFPPDTGEVREVPWDRASRTKSNEDYDHTRVRDALRAPPHLEEVDPTNLRATQREITKGGVEYYTGRQYDRTGETYADKANPGNRFPLVYKREPVRPGAEPEHLLLSGHHRAAAALAEGRPLRAITVTGPWGPPRHR